MNFPVAIIVCLVLAAIGVGSAMLLQPDNHIEEAMEEAIEAIVEQQIHTPLPFKIDLTPNTTEGDKENGKR
jgi:hypothetical protein